MLSDSWYILSVKDQFKSITCSAENTEAIYYFVLNFSVSFGNDTYEKGLSRNVLANTVSVEGLFGI